jgi:hypothetical protein
MSHSTDCRLQNTRDDPGLDAEDRALDAIEFKQIEVPSLKTPLIFIGHKDSPLGQI